MQFCLLFCTLSEVFKFSIILAFAINIFSPNYQRLALQQLVKHSKLYHVFQKLNQKHELYGMYAVEGEQKVYLLQSTLSAGKFTIQLLASIFMLPKGEAYSRRFVLLSVRYLVWRITLKLLLAFR